MIQFNPRKNSGRLSCSASPGPAWKCTGLWTHPGPLPGLPGTGWPLTGHTFHLPLQPPTLRMSRKLSWGTFCLQRRKFSPLIFTLESFVFYISFMFKKLLLSSHKRQSTEPTSSNKWAGAAREKEKCVICVSKSCWARCSQTTRSEKDGPKTGEDASETSPHLVSARKSPKWGPNYNFKQKCLAFDSLNFLRR